MSELNRPASVRELLDVLPRTTLVYLCELRGLPVSRANDDCRSSIARSFRGRRDEFLSVLRKDELIHLLHHGIRDRESVFDLPNPYTYSKRELQELAIAAFGRIQDLGRPFVLRATGAAAPASRAPEPEPRPEPEPEPAEDPMPSTDRLGGVDGRLGSGWSRPRPVRALLAQVGQSVPSTLSQEDFGTLMDALEERGFEVATLDGTRLTSLHDAVSIDAELRIRHDALALPVASVRAVSAETSRSAADAAELGDYERACLRLELLTACAATESPSPAFVADCLARATAGLALAESARAVLSNIVVRLTRLPRDPFLALHRMASRLDVEDGEVLVREYCALHAVDGETSALLQDHWQALAASRRGPVAGVAEE